MRVLLPCLAVLALFLSPANAQEEEAAVQLTDAELDARTHEVAKTLRCVVCKNQSIAESDATLAKDLENIVRDRIAEGDTNDEAREFVVARYGEFVLLKPRFSWKNLVLWAGPLVVLALGAFGAFAFIRTRRGGAPQAAELSAEERAELDRLRGS